MVKHWLMKSEAEAYSIHDLERDGTTHWHGVRNYQARNYMQAMAVGDRVLFYHSNADPSGVAGIAEVSRKAYPDFTAFDPKDSHFDRKSNPEKPTWFMVDLKQVATFPQVVALEQLNGEHKLSGMMLTSGKAMRLSVQPISKPHYDQVVRMGLPKSKPR